MQETEGPDGAMLREIFRAEDEAKLKEAMDARLRELRSGGHTLVRRVALNGDGSVATENRNTGKPHENRRETARRLRQAGGR